MINIKHKIMIFIFLLNHLLFGQAYFQGTNQPESAAGWGMASSTSTVYNMGAGISLNPAVISLSPSCIHTNLTSFVLDINSLNIQGLFTNKYYSWGASVSYLNFGDFTGRDENGTETGNFQASDNQFSLYFGRKIVKNIYFGLSGSYLHSNLSTFSSNVATGTAGVVYHNPKSTLTIGLAYKNFGYSFSSYANKNESPPRILMLGVSKHLAYLPVLISIDLQKIENLSSIINLGLEIDVKEYVVLRIGSSSKRFNLQNEYDIKNFIAGSSCGFGIKLKDYHFDFGYSFLGNAGNISSISISKVL